ncbi:MAG: L,D-transpeptidase [Solirubrobacterales bacterium]
MALTSAPSAQGANFPNTPLGTDPFDRTATRDVTAAGLPAGYRKLSNERTKTVTATVRRRTGVRRYPSTRSRRITTLRPETWYGLQERVTVLGLVKRSERLWSRVRYPGRYNRVGWIPTDALGSGRTITTQIVVNRQTRRLTLYKDGKRQMTARVGVGASGSPTPVGRFYIRERLIPSNRRGLYGPRAFGLSSYSPYRTDWPGGGQVGIHGTNQPGLIPGRISNGCIRLKNRDVLRLDRRLTLGTPVLVK